jgi:Neurotransmitter-gated ion-channel ligand binding domain
VKNKEENMKMVSLRGYATKPGFFFYLLIIFIILAISAAAGIDVVRAQESESQVQVLSGRIAPGSRVVYRLPDLSAGQTLYVRMENTSGNLDPIILLLEKDANITALAEASNLELDQAVSEGRDPMVTLPEIFNRYSIIWNDDYADDSSAAFEFAIPEDPPQSSYQLVVTGAWGANTFGEYKLLVGLNAPEVLSGRAVPTGDKIAFFDQSASKIEVSVKEVNGEITAQQPQNKLTLRDLNAGDTVYAYVEATSGDLAPTLILQNYNNKPLRSGNASGTQTQTSLEYQLDRDVSNYKISVESFKKDGKIPTGEYRLLIGVNAPEVLSGKVQPGGSSPLVEPIEVRIGAMLDQITGVDPKAEKFGAVAQLRMEWQDPALAFNPDNCQCDFVTYTGDGFSKFAETQKILWPEFTLFNQQGNRWVQNRNVVVFPDGRVIYFERFTTDFQAPLFNFVKFPFDEQQLYIQATSIAPEIFFTYTDPPELSAIGTQLGEEEWYIVSSDTQITNEGNRASYWLRFNVQRHLNFFIFRIFVPIGLVILVSWLTFFLKDFGKRVDVASANLLLFVAFNFTISSELPRLGYLTFMDAILIGTFVVSILVVMFNVFLKRLELHGRPELAQRIDRPMIWLYPLLYILGVAVAIWQFLM